ncbi:hypothetical protein [Pseudomonas aeruginosa]|uniref:hypothetical protein n=1 Tax=Pseudomonas aeruginosa TaxID=287 RepID=UPI00117A6018|nr:hypothetical protein [Pseudomonas aeruginosa]TRO73858.1 hypothetical protein FMF10_22960 [Pseudomonas aeruginosa]HEH9446318.1 hypothetical protein [Pseudomonas aeruginosa]
MTKANECTCPSGDGSLRHPCPAHPAVEQAGGDERAAFEQREAEQIRFVLRQIGSMDTGDIDGDDVDLRFEDADGRDTGCDVSIVEYADKAANLIEAMLAERAALALASSAQTEHERGTQHRFSTTEQTCRHDFAGVWWNDKGVTKTGRECRHCGFFIADMAEAPELERPELPKRYTADVFYHNHFSTVQMEVVRASHFDEFVAQHDRIVGALRAHIADLEAARDSRVAERLATLDRLTRERDAALAGVAELEKQVPAGVPMPDEIHQMAFEEGQPADDGDGYLFSAEEFDLFVQRLLDSCAAPVAQAQHSVPEGYALVPLEPTDDMLVAGQEAWAHKMERRGALEDCEEAGDVYRAMLAAAPGKEVGHE